MTYEERRALILALVQQAKMKNLECECKAPGCTGIPHPGRVYEKGRWRYWCKCRTCGAKYDQNTARALYTGYCTSRCEMLAESRNPQFPKGAIPWKSE